MGDDLTVAEAADALGTSPQTVRSLLRKGELDGRRRQWGSRFVWDVSRAGVDEFLAEYGRLDGRRRSARPDTTSLSPLFRTDPPLSFPEATRVDHRPFVLRPRGRATVVVVVLGVPLVLAYLGARILHGVWWFDEIGQEEVFTRILAAKVEVAVLFTLVASLVVGANLALALRRTDALRTSAGVLAVTAVALATGSRFGSAAVGHWQTYLLWRHRQPFGAVDPIHGRDIGFFVFTLPLEHYVFGLLLWLLAITFAYVVIVNKALGSLGFRPLRATFGAQMHLASLAAALLLVLAWRLRLAQYDMELAQPSAWPGNSFPGAGYVDVHVRLPGLGALVVLVLVLAAACLLAPFATRTGHARSAGRFLVLPVAGLVLATLLVEAVVPALVQRYVVDPSPLLREERYLAASIAATRTGLGLDAVDVQPYAPTGTFTAADFRSVGDRLPRVTIWDNWLLGARMRQLATDTPYFQPDDPVLDINRSHGRRQPTAVSTRDLDLRQAPATVSSWVNDRLAYTHGLGLVRYSATDTIFARGPRLISHGLGVRQPRIYFGNFPHGGADRSGAKGAGGQWGRPIADPYWAVADTRRAEVDVPASENYHYDGTGGILLSSWIRRAVFALELGSKQLLLSDDITPQSRILLHRDVHDRLRTLAPFIQWDAAATPVTEDGHIVFLVDGYTTSESYPYADRVDLGESRVNYARASVRATVDAFSGQVEIYLVDEEDPIAGAWADVFPGLFRPADEMPAELRRRLRYPADLFDAQASAYNRYHTTDPDVFASDADVWAPPIALSGGIEVAGGVDFDQSDEDNLRLTMQPGYAFSAPPGHTEPRLVLSALFSPLRGQNLVGTLSGWIDDQGRTRLAARSLPRDQVSLGTAQMSRLTFATPRVSNLLGLRNLETADLNKSSIDNVLLGRPQLLFPPGGIIQIQSLFEGSRGPGAARLLGVTAFLNGRAGLGPDIESAVRQALNDPPSVHLHRPHAPFVVDEPIHLWFDVENARRETVTITSAAGDEHRVRRVLTGLGKVRWVPRATGPARVRVEVKGLDGTSVVRRMTVHVHNHPPKVRVTSAPKHAVVGEIVRISFDVTNAVRASAEVSTRAGVVFARDYLIRDGPGVMKWVPQTPGSAVVVIRVRGHQGQVVTKKLRIKIAHRPEVAPPPVVTILHVPASPTVGEESTIAFRADGCRSVVAQIEGPDDTRTWRFPCADRRSTFSWRPATPGEFLLTIVAHGEDGQTSSQTVRLTVADVTATETATPQP